MLPFPRMTGLDTQQFNMLTLALSRAMTAPMGIQDMVLAARIRPVQWAQAGYTYTTPSNCQNRF